MRRARWSTLVLLIAAVAVYLVAGVLRWDAEARLSSGGTAYPVLTVVEAVPQDPELPAREANCRTVQRIALVAGLVVLCAHLVVVNVGCSALSREVDAARR